jgi:hypothetical protein
MRWNGRAGDHADRLELPATRKHSAAHEAESTVVKVVTIPVIETCPLSPGAIEEIQAATWEEAVRSGDHVSHEVLPDLAVIIRQTIGKRRRGGKQKEPAVLVNIRAYQDRASGLEGHDAILKIADTTGFAVGLSPDPHDSCRCFDT